MLKAKPKTRSIIGRKTKALIVGGALATGLLLAQQPKPSASLIKTEPRSAVVSKTVHETKKVEPVLKPKTTNPARVITREQIPQTINHQFRIVGPPAAHLPPIRESVIRWQLNRINPEVMGVAPEIVRICAEEQVNPAYLVAKWNAESNCGKAGLAKKTKSIGNIRYTPPREGSVPYVNYNGFRSYSTFSDSIRDFCRLTRSYHERHQLSSLREITDRWTPSTENNTRTHEQHIIGLMRNMYTHALDTSTTSTIQAKPSAKP